MPVSASSFSRDANSIPITEHGLTVTKSLTFTGDGATVATACFTVKGTVEVLALYGIITTVLGANQTNCHWRVNDQTATDQIITKATTLTLSSAPVGSLIAKTGLITAVATYKSNAAGAFYEPTTLQTNLFTPFIVIQKTASVQTDIEWVYTTSDSPTSGTIKFYCCFIPLSDDGDVIAS